MLNEGIGTHSIYHPDRLLTGGPWDYFLLAPLIGGQPTTEVNSLLIVGLGAGTVSKQYTAVYGDDVQMTVSNSTPRSLSSASATSI